MKKRLKTIQTTEDLESHELDLAPYALKSKERREELGESFREAPTKAKLEFRTEYHRDRDRILWSKAFKRLQHKTQVFPHYVEDHYKRRLTHSLEVAQIATTVARALKLNEAATEAIALGHDLGHTPFGHAGEKALNKILTAESKVLDPGIRKEIGKLKKLKSKKVPIFGFDHCVHAIEVVSRIEKEYDHETNHGGLNLTFDVRNGILKHMCSREDTKIKKERPFSNIPGVVKFDKYKDFDINKGSLEAQCVYFADKVTYLLGDIEDGIRSNILKCEELKGSKGGFYRKLEEKYKGYRGKEEEFKFDKKEDFVYFRSQALTTLILDCIDNAKKQLEQNGFKDVDKVLSHKNRIVFVSDDLNKSWRDFYKRWMEEYLFENERVKACGFKAEKIITGLFEAYWREEGLIKREYREHCKKVYKKIGVRDEKLLALIMVRNYIAGMTDAFATDQHASLFMPSEHIRF